tara:strand:- start:447 stop:626 length:180 start_codon:yes stop_codon:yes gene_type:complete
MINQRSIAKENKDYALADEIRKKLKERGIELIDKSNGISEWKYSSGYATQDSIKAETLT